MTTDTGDAAEGTRHPPRLGFIDALRGWAILGVVIVHTAQAVGLEGLGLRYAESGARGVQLFFLLSALSLSYSFHYRRKAEPHPYRNFFLRRFFRIAPMFYIAIVFWTLYYRSAPQFWDPDGISFRDVLLTATFLQGWSPVTINSVVPGGWSIAAEVGAYALMPLMFAIGATLPAAIALAAILLIAGGEASRLAYESLQLSYPASAKYLVQPFVNFWLPSQLMVFAAGRATFHVIRSIRIDSPLRHFVGLVSTAAGVILVAIIPLQQWEFDGLTRTAQFITDRASYTTAFALIAVGLSITEPRVLVNVVMRHVGKVSYSLYFVHFVLLWATPQFFTGGSSQTPAGVRFAIALGLVMSIGTAISTFTYNLIELPCMRFGQKLIRWQSRSAELSPQR